MATGITTYQCPACTGPLHFVGESGRLECDYCGKSYDVTEIERLFSEKEAASIEAQEKADAKQEKEKAAAEEMGVSWDEQETAGMKAYNCPFLRRRVDLRRDYRSNELPLLRKSHHRPRPVYRRAKAGIGDPLQAG